MSNQAGKGDKYRPVKKAKFDENFEKIKWEKKYTNNCRKKNGVVRYVYK